MSSADPGTSGGGMGLERRQAKLDADPSPTETRPAAEVSPDIPPDNGRRASIDPETGEVRGSGVGAGGGALGEDFSDDAAAGGGGPKPGLEPDDMVNPG